MARYVDGFIIPLPKKNLNAYLRMARAAGKIWKEHGALEYRECAGDDLKNRWGVSFSRMAKAKPGETVVFSWIVYKSKADRKKVNAAVMKDPRVRRMMTIASPFDMKRMAYGGFKVIVEK